MKKFKWLLLLVVVIGGVALLIWSGMNIHDRLFDETTPKVTTRRSSTHTCQASGCYREGTKKITGFSGTTEYYCSTHYNEMSGIWNSVTKKYMACELCGKMTNCTYTTSLGLSFWVCPSCRSWMLGD